MSVICPRCGEVNPQGATSCANCSLTLESQLVKICPHCFTQNLAATDFCRNCGHNLAAVASQTGPLTRNPATTRQPLNRREVAIGVALGLLPNVFMWLLFGTKFNAVVIYATVLSWVGLLIAGIVLVVRGNRSLGTGLLVTVGGVDPVVAVVTCFAGISISNHQ